jgi:ICP0-binding domain of Ubiquitin-specific protease 7
VFLGIIFDCGILLIGRIKLFGLMFLSRLIHFKVPPPPMSALTIAIEGWYKNSSSRGPDFRIYMEKAEDIWHPTVPILPKRANPLTPMTSPPIPPPRYSDDISTPRSNSSSNGLSSHSNGDIELETTTNTPDIEWPEVGKLPGVYNARHDASMILIFLKYFDVDAQRLRGFKPIYVNRHDKTGKLTSVVAETMDWRAEGGEVVNIAFYEEIKPGMIEPLKPNVTFLASEIQDGDIICFMRAQTSKRYTPPSSSEYWSWDGLLIVG